MRSMISRRPSRISSRSKGVISARLMEIPSLKPGLGWLQAEIHYGITRSSKAMVVLSMQDNAGVIAIHDELFQLPVPSQCQEMIENTNTFFMFLRNNSTCKHAPSGAPAYYRKTRSISILLMPWLLASPGHQQPWYWLCVMSIFLSSVWVNFNNLRCFCFEDWCEMETHHIFSEKSNTKISNHHISTYYSMVSPCGGCCRVVSSSVTQPR